MNSRENQNRYLYMMSWLSKEWVPFDVIDYLYGINDLDDVLRDNFRAWSRERPNRLVIKPDKINRYAFETYLQQAKLLPTKIAAAHLGMTKNSYDKFIKELSKTGAIPINQGYFSSQVVSEQFIKSLLYLLPSLRHKIFGDHDNFCNLLHSAIKRDLKCKVEPLFCVTSQFLKEEPSDFAYEFDSITGEPVGLRYQVWLNFNKKPLHLKPDICSLKFYAENIKKLSDFLFVRQEPEIPAILRKAI